MRLGAGSANPYFVHSEAQTTAHSGNQFLDFELPFALTNLVQTQLLTLGLWQRAIQHWSDGHQDGAHAIVQPPKVAQAYVERALQEAGGLPSKFTGSDSEGIEDLRDLTVQTAIQSLQLGKYNQALESLWNSIQGPTGDVQDRLRTLETAAFGTSGLLTAENQVELSAEVRELLR